MLLRAQLFRGYIGLDDAEYGKFAYEISQGTFPPAAYTGPAVFPLRVGVTAPTAAAFSLFGVGEWTLVLYPLLVSLATVLLAFWCARTTP